ncbi:MAG: tRNA-dihydrouridine synthase family protein [Bilophila sp.]
MTLSLQGTTERLPFSPDAPWLAPLAGWSDLAFRLLCREGGAAVCCTEMISAKGLIYKSPGTAELLATHPKDTPLVLQLFGSEASFMGEAVHRLKDQGFVWFDCNMGCSVHKVTRAGAGAAMCRDVDNALRVAEAMIREAGEGRVGFKMRLGWDAPRIDEQTDAHHEVWRTLAPALEALGAGWLTLHPRTAKQGFTGNARWSALAALKRLVSLPVIASGDLFLPEDGVRCLRETGVDTVMYARGALRDPAVFAAHKTLLLGGVPCVADTATLLERIRHHAQLARELTPERNALLKMRTIVPRYIRHLQGARQLRLAIIACRSWDDFEQALQTYVLSE